MADNCVRCNGELNLVSFNDELYCPACLDEISCLCYHCEGRFLDGSLSALEDDVYCENCLDAVSTICHECGERILDENSFNSELESEDYCCDCYSDRFTRCVDCEREIYQEDAHFAHEEPHCSDCYHGSENRLQPYDYRPEPKFYGRNENDLYFGIELEAETKNDNIDEAVDLMPEFVYCKHDGSLDKDGGMEIVSHPLSWKWIMSHKKQWNEILNIKQIGFRSFDTGTCGVHIHLSKKAFSTLHLYRFIKLFYDNGDKILSISQRRPDRLKQWAALEDGSGETLAYKAKYKTCCYRYSAVNLQNRDTVEIRIFRGTLRQNSFYKNLEFAHAAFYYTKQVGMTSDVSWWGFAEYVLKNKKTYKNLVDFMKEENLCASPFTNPKAKTSAEKSSKDVGTTTITAEVLCSPSTES